MAALVEAVKQVSDLDTYHRHLFPYDRRVGCVVAACRVGPGRTILRQHPKCDFWTGLSTKATMSQLALKG